MKEAVRIPQRYVTLATTRRAYLSWAEFEVPNVPHRAQISWAEFEIPDVTTRRAQLSWAEFEAPNPFDAVVGGGPKGSIYPLFISARK